MGRLKMQHHCRICGEKDPKQFSQGYKGKCKVCRSVEQRQWEKDNWDYLRQWKKDYRKRNKKHIQKVSHDYYIKKRNAWYEFLSECVQLKCKHCGYDKHVAALNFHHTDPSTKKFGIGTMTGTLRLTEDNKKLIKSEVEKCIVLCANCHNIEHWED